MAAAAIFNKNSSGDEVANVNFLPRHRKCTGQRLRPLQALYYQSINQFIKIHTSNVHASVQIA